jgi:phosphoserine phosphatase
VAKNPRTSRLGRMSNRVSLEDRTLATTVIIIRHGQSTYNLEGRIQGQCDKSVLTDRGIADARKVGEALKGVTFDAVYCSPLQRAQQTAREICATIETDITPQPLDLVKEIDLPLWEEMLRSDVMAKYPEAYQIWKDQPEQFSMTVTGENGETIERFPVLELFDRARQFWTEILPQHDGKTIAIVAHNGINRSLIATALKIAPRYYPSIQQSNCCINVLKFSGGLTDTVQLESLNQLAHLGNPFPTYRKPHHGPRIFLVRHGETQWNRESRFQGQIDIPLNENGQAQGRKAAEFLKEVELDFAVSSPLSRPKETAQFILEHHPGIELTYKDELKEIGHGLWEGKLEAEISAEYADLLEQWKVKPETVQMPEGENLQQVWDRVKVDWEAIVREYAASETPRSGIVVAHDAVNKAILCELFELPPEFFWNFKQGNGAVSIIDYPDGADGLPVLQSMNITSHLSGGVFDRTAAGAL